MLRFRAARIPWYTGPSGTYFKIKERQIIQTQMKKADYDKIASFYDQGRTISDQNIDLWLDLIKEFSKASSGARVLDLGCGTGRFTIPMATKLRLSVTGADSSREMLAKAKEKDGAGIVTWDCQDAEHLTYPGSSFDLVFASHLLHHIDSPLRVLRECKRVLRNPGAMLVRYGAIEHNRNDVEHTFFPETLAIDEIRIPSVRTVESWLTDIGFVGVHSKEVMQQSYETSIVHLNAVKVKHTSVLTMITQEIFERGLRRLEKYIKSHPDDKWLLMDTITMTVGHKTAT